MITKKAIDEKKFLRTWQYTDSARHAWSMIIDRFKLQYPKGVILLPAYIGWSPNEGSGIFDSVLLSGMSFDFYKIDEQLQINFDFLKCTISKYQDVLVLLVHYFGFYDKNYPEISNYLLGQKIFFVEDCAHAWLTDLLTGECGRKGNYSFYSLHKLLPLNNGGMVVNNYPNENDSFSDLEKNGLSYDLFAIYKKRMENYIYLLDRLKYFQGIEILHKELGNVCPQSFPVILKDIDRDLLYFKMNKEGYGLVSLYHTMIENLHSEEYTVSLNLSKQIINFPIHQDVEETDLDSMLIKLKSILRV